MSSVFWQCFLSCIYSNILVLGFLINFDDFPMTAEKRQRYMKLVPTKSDSDVILCLQLLSDNKLCTPLDLTRIDRILVYQSYPQD